MGIYPGFIWDSIPCFPSYAESGNWGFSGIPFPVFPVVPRAGMGIYPGFIWDSIPCFPSCSKAGNGDFSGIPFAVFPVMQRVGIGVYLGFHSLFFPVVPRAGMGIYPGFIRDLSRIYLGFHSLFSQLCQGWELGFFWDSIPCFPSCSKGRNGDLSRIYPGFIWDSIPCFPSCSKAGNWDLSQIPSPAFPAVPSAGNEDSSSISPGFLQDSIPCFFPTLQRVGIAAAWAQFLEKRPGNVGEKSGRRSQPVSRDGNGGVPRGGWTWIGRASRSFPTERIPGFQMGPPRGLLGLGWGGSEFPAGILFPGISAAGEDGALGGGKSGICLPGAGIRRISRWVFGGGGGGG
ncbi:uncharacterized protein LOC116436597 [Corvus moneduloides]|uniref:uncharacterized protein LOC116436597 n=1 Tax=Corvus moneduloides TaxID=1196302 RepID=UPI001363F224|nr:uncharacterized protein LOC116436597 [Corvus moneduloides]